MTDRSAYPTRKTRLGEELPDPVGLDPAARLEMVWQLTLQAWAFKGLDHEPGLRRDVGRAPASDASRARTVPGSLLTARRTRGRAIVLGAGRLKFLSGHDDG
jgi:hypothetical protein